MAQGPLAGINVLDLTEGISGPYCTKILADCGAEVLKVERPRTGDWTRHRGPFFHDRPDPDHSLLFAYLNTNKRSLTLDLGSPQASRDDHCVSPCNRA
ncbi:MAG: CoA transferase [Chloroflexota bacterium]|nr:CoA transferase [Chloroflexota bacterium]